MYKYKNNAGQYYRIVKELGSYGSNKERYFRIQFKDTGNIKDISETKLKNNDFEDVIIEKNKTTRKKKQNIDIRIILDTREKDVSLMNKIKIDKDYCKDKIKISDIKIDTVKPLGVITSTGDLTIEYKTDDNIWKKTKLSIELKRGSDIFTTLFSNKKRFKNELERAKLYDLDFVVLHDWTFDDVKNHIKQLQGMRKIGYKSNPFLTYIENYLELSKDTTFICCGNNFEETIRRIIKKHIKNNKLQYR
jgi:hypothetical protein